MMVEFISLSEAKGLSQSIILPYSVKPNYHRDIPKVLTLISIQEIHYKNIMLPDEKTLCCLFPLNASKASPSPLLEILELVVDFLNVHFTPVDVVIAIDGIYDIVIKAVELLKEVQLFFYLQELGILSYL